jgi:hypothetical protein
MNARSIPTPGAWLFSRRLDLAVFLGSAIVSFGALGLGAITGVLHDETPGWAWVPAIVLCDVAHVWATIFRTYLDPGERRARRRLFTIAPIVGLAASVALYAVGEAAFWRALAYLAIFHFVRQQYGWVALYRARAGERGGLGRAIDTAAIYAATIFPLLYWHTHLPRRFAWFVRGDIVALPAFVLPIATVLYAIALLAYAARAATLWIRGAPNPGKDVVVATTAAAWFVGIVVFDSDYAFTVTNVLMHGIPYFALVYVHSRARPRPEDPKAWPLGARLTASLPIFLGALWIVAFGEELLWDRAVWHDRPWLFGEAWDIGAAKALVVPLLALPQLTHYVLDGFIWRRRSNPSVAELVSTPASRDALDVEPVTA